MPETGNVVAPGCLNDLRCARFAIPCLAYPSPVRRSKNAVPVRSCQHRPKPQRRDLPRRTKNFHKARVYWRSQLSASSSLLSGSVRNRTGVNDRPLCLKILVSVVRFRSGAPRVCLTKRQPLPIGVFVSGLWSHRVRSISSAPRIETGKLATESSNRPAY